MRKRFIQKAVALLVCFVFLGLSASGLMAAPRETPRIDASLILKAPAQFLVNLLPFLRSLFQNNNPAQTQPTSTGTVNIIKPTGTIKVIRLSGGD